MRTQTPDYRKSHLSKNKPVGYQSQFEDTGNVKGLYWLLEKQLLDSIFPPDGTNAGQTLIDFACGTGRVLAHLSSRFRASIGIDVSSAMIDEARKHVDAKFIVGDVTCDKIDDDLEAHVITAFRFFLNAQPALRLETLKWMRSCLIDGGSLVCNFHLNPDSLVGMKMRAMKRLRGWETTPMMSVREATTMLRSAGFSVKKVFGYGHLYYGQYRLWAPMKVLLPIERALARRPGCLRYARNFLVVVEKS